MSARNGPNIGILDYGRGNTQSVINAFKFVGGNVKLITPHEIDNVDALVLPGVGAFKDTMSLLIPHNDALLDFLHCGKPFFGICIGLQYLFEESFENGRWGGLGFFKGQVRKLSSQKLPQIGWNSIAIRSKSPILKGVLDGDYFYYINSYAAPPDDSLATSAYDEPFAAIVGSGNVFATQFHPEKSGEKGLKIIRNFVEVVERCS